MLVAVRTCPTQSWVNPAEPLYVYFKSSTSICSTRKGTHGCWFRKFDSKQNEHEVC